MANVVKTEVKDFNLPMLMEELEASVVPAFGLMMAGFEKANSALYEPNAATKVIGSVTDPSGTVEDTAEPGELRFEFRNALTSAQDTALDSTLAGHVASNRTDEQVRQAQDVTDANQLLADYPSYDAMTAAQKNAVNKVMLRVVIRSELGKAAEI